MDFTTYETFLENLASIVRGIGNLIYEAESHKNLPLVWSPLQPDFIAVGKLKSFRVELENASRNSIIPFILQYIDEDNYVVELTYIVDDEHKDKNLASMLLLDINIYRVGRAYFTTRFNIMVYHIEYTYKDYNTNQMRKNVQFFGSRNELAAFIQYINSKTDVNIINVWGF